MPDVSPPGFRRGQLLHVLALALLLTAAGSAWNRLGRPFPAAFWAAVGVPVVHQVYVWFTWRLELNHGTVSRRVGFGAYFAVFMVLFGGRFAALAALGWVDRGTLGLDDLPRVVVTILLLVPGLYAAYSVQRYFGQARAAGADHFDERYRSMPLVDRGIFRYTRNGMYTCAFLLFWAIAVGFDSAAALAAAAFGHAYIWVHYFATEKPDMRYLYGRGREGAKL